MARFPADGLPLPNDSADFLFTDPPYFAAIPTQTSRTCFTSGFGEVWVARILIYSPPNSPRKSLSWLSPTQVEGRRGL